MMFMLEKKLIKNPWAKNGLAIVILRKGQTKDHKSIIKKDFLMNYNYKNMFTISGFIFVMVMTLFLATYTNVNAKEIIDKTCPDPTIVENILITEGTTWSVVSIEGKDLDNATINLLNANKQELQINTDFRIISQSNTKIELEISTTSALWLEGFFKVELSKNGCATAEFSIYVGQAKSKSKSECPSVDITGRTILNADTLWAPAYIKGDGLSYTEITITDADGKLLNIGSDVFIDNQIYDAISLRVNQDSLPPSATTFIQIRLEQGVCNPVEFGILLEFPGEPGDLPGEG